MLVKIQLPNNNLCGSFPNGVTELRLLRGLDLSNNALTGKYLNVCLKKISAFKYLLFQGSLPPAIGKLQQLQIINVENNELSGPVPTEITTLENLRCKIDSFCAFFTYRGFCADLIISSNQFSGPIPADIGNLKLMKVFQVSYNQLTGPLPQSMEAMKELRLFQVLKLFSTCQHQYINYCVQASHNKLEGPLLPQLFSLPELQAFGVNNNKFKGPIPEEVGNCASLLGLNLSSNQVLLCITVSLSKKKLTFVFVIFRTSSRALYQQVFKTAKVYAQLSWKTMSFRFDPSEFHYWAIIYITTK